MKNLYRKGLVHPTPTVVSDHFLSFLPVAILTLTLALSPEEKEVLAYLISHSSNFSHHNKNRKTSPKTSVSSTAKSSPDHPPCFNCCCFRCYMSYWVKWDSSLNRELIHDIMDAYEESLMKEGKKGKGNKKNKRKDRSVKENTSVISTESKNLESKSLMNEDSEFTKSTSAKVHDMNLEEMEKGSVRRLVSFVGERIWSVWGIKSGEESK